jgi:adenylate kinase
MTTLQMIIKKAQALRKAAPKKYAKWTDYVKAASATIKPKKKAAVGAVKKKAVKKAAPKKVVKKAAPKKATSIHKDSKSHNVRINVVSGLTKGQEKMLDTWLNIYARLSKEYIVAKPYEKKIIKKEMVISKQIIDKLKKMKSI